MAHARVVGQEAELLTRDRRGFRRQHDGTVQHGIVVRFVRHLLEPGRHRQLDFHLVAALPLALDADIAVGAGFGGYRAAVDRHLHGAARHPRRVADLHGELAVASDRNRAAVLVRELAGLRDGEVLLFPLERGRDEQVDVQRILAVGVDEFTVLGVALDTGPYAAPHALVHLRIHAVVIGAHRREVDESARIGPLRRQDVVVQRALVVIAVRTPGIAEEQQLGELEHIVGIAGLGPLHLVDHRRKIVGGVEVLLDAVAADGHRAMVMHGLPEELRGLLPVAPAGHVADAFEADHLRNLRVGVQAGELVLLFFERAQDGLVRKAHRQVQVLLLPRHLGHVGQHLVHAAVLRAQHVLHLFIGQVRAQCQRPVGQGDQHRARVLVAGVLVGVAQARVHLVQVVPRHPFAVDREVIGLHFTARDGLPHGAALGDAAEVAIAVLFLAALELRDEVVEPLLDFSVTGGRKHQRQRRQVMAAHVAIETAGLPVAVSRLFERQASLAQKWRQQAVRVHLHHVMEVGLLRFQEWAGAQAYVLQWEQL